MQPKVANPYFNRTHLHYHVATSVYQATQLSHLAVQLHQENKNNVTIYHVSDLLSSFTFSAINPILYNAMSDKFRKAFRRLLSCGKLTEPPQVPGGHNHLYCYQNNHHHHNQNHQSHNPATRHPSEGRKGRLGSRCSAGSSNLMLATTQEPDSIVKILA